MSPFKLTKNRQMKPSVFVPFWGDVLKTPPKKRTFIANPGKSLIFIGEKKIGEAHSKMGASHMLGAS